MEDEPAFPRHSQILVQVTVRKEGSDISDERVLGFRVEDYVGPGGALHGFEEFVGFGPGAFVEDPDFVVECTAPGADGEEEFVSRR